MDITEGGVFLLMLKNKRFCVFFVSRKIKKLVVGLFCFVFFFWLLLPGGVSNVVKLAEYGIHC